MILCQIAKTCFKLNLPQIHKYRPVEETGKLQFKIKHHQNLWVYDKLKVFPSPAAIPNWPVIELDTDCPARLAATPKLPSKLCSHSPEGLHWLKLELPSVKDFRILILLWFCCLTYMSLKDKILTWGSALTFNFLTSFLLGNSCLNTQTEGWLLEHQTTLLEAVPLVGQIFGGCFPQVLTTSLRTGGAPRRGAMTAQLCVPKTNEDWWTGLVDLTFWPTCVLQSGTSTCLRVNVRRAIWADGHTMQINLRTPSKPLVWSNAYKCCFVCLLYGRYYFAPSLSEHTFFKKNNVNVYSIWVSCFFFSATLRK